LTSFIGLTVSVDGVATDDELAKEITKSLHREFDDFILGLAGRFELRAPE
jgi:hypothetical protein